ncbi:MAG TPA: hypothetical protein VF861_06385 [Telluria sp.]
MGVLENDELQILRSLESGAGVLEGMGQQGVSVPKRLFEFGLLRREPGGALALTKLAERLLFRLSCVSALRRENKPVSRGVREWLAKSGFITLSADGESLVEVTGRGQLWLSSLDEYEPAGLAP